MLSTSSDLDEDLGTPARRARPARRDGMRPWVPTAVFSGGVALAALLMFWGAWERRWIADDGLIVLRTVRNLLAGNGPVFNAGDRVEANTSTLWTYLVYAMGWLTGVRLEYVVLATALVLSTAAVVLAMLGTGRLYRWRLRGGGGGATFLLVPAGMFVYIAVPPARDFATSGLESGLVICWIALLWLLLVRWATAPGTPSAPSVLATAFVAGLGPLVRPELALLALPALLMLFLAAGLTWRVRIAMVAVAGAVPVAYQIWRMGYYGLPYPNTAVAKDAGGAKWSQGFEYLGNLVSPYLLWLPLLLLLLGAALAWRDRTPLAPGASKREIRHTEASFAVRAQRALRTPSAVVVFMLGAGVLLTLYALRVGGDFMHGRVLLPPLFCLLVPVAVIPLRVPTEIGRTRTTAVAGAAGALWLGVVVWSAIAANTTGMPEGAVVGRSGIVDERAFYALNTGHLHPVRAEDYLDYPRMRAMVEAISNTPDGGLLLPTPSFDAWDVVPPPEPVPPGGAGHTVYFLNLGMTSMNVGLDVQVLDQMGLAYPLAAHTERLEDGRIGHDKLLYSDWVVADTGMVDVHPWLPAYLDEDWVAQAQVALTCPQTQELLASSRAELTWPLFKRNLRNSFEYADYRLDRVPKYEIQRCGLELPPPRDGG